MVKKESEEFWEKEIVRLDKFLNKPKTHCKKFLLFHQKGNKLIEYYKLIEKETLNEGGLNKADPNILENALECYRQSLEEKPDYDFCRADRCKLLCELKREKEAAEDLNRIQVNRMEDGSLKDYVQNIQREMVALNGISKEIEQLKQNETINPELADVLEKHVQQTRELTLRVNTHGEILDEHGDRIMSIEEKYNELEKQLIEVKKNSEAEKTGMKDIIERMEDEQLVLKVKISKSINKNDVEPYVFKTDPEISEDSKLKAYFDYIYGKLDAGFVNAMLICEGKLVFDASTITSKLAGSAISKSLTYFTGKKVGNIFKPLLEQPEKNRIKKQATNVSSSLMNPDDKKNIIKEISQKITKNRKAIIENLKLDSDEVRHFTYKGFIQMAKNEFDFNVTDHIYKSPYEMLGCIDALKVLYVLRKGLVENEGSVDFVERLIKIPNDYEMKFKHGALRNIYCETKFKKKTIDETEIIATDYAYDVERACNGVSI